MKQGHSYAMLDQQSTEEVTPHHCRPHLRGLEASISVTQSHTLPHKSLENILDTPGRKVLGLHGEEKELN